MAQQADELEVAKLADRLFVVSGAGANVTVLVGDAGVLLVDSGSPEYAAALRSRIAVLSGGLPVDVIFNTNWRYEHTGGNAQLSHPGTRVMAHENTRLWMTIPFTVEWENRDYPERPESARPNTTFYTSGELDFGGYSVRYEHYPMAHTDGDICVYLPEQNVIVASDLMTVGSYPLVDYVTGGWIGGMERALSGLIELTDSDTRVVPAVGPVQSLTDLQNQLALCTSVREAVREAYRNGRGLEEFAAAEPTAQYDSQRGDPELFLYLVYKGTWGHARELGAGII
jgi:cyclase